MRYRMEAMARDPVDTLKGEGTAEQKPERRSGFERIRAIRCEGIPQDP